MPLFTAFVISKVAVTVPVYLPCPTSVILAVPTLVLFEYETV